MRRSTIGLAVFASALLLFALAPSVSVAQQMTVQMTVGATDPWKDTFSVSPCFVV
jgi:hypothetical protein